MKIRTNIKYVPLPQPLREEIDHLCKKGAHALETGLPEDAYEAFAKAWNLLPLPQHQWVPVLKILAGVVEAHLRAGRPDEALSEVEYAIVHCGAFANYYFHLRRGQLLFDRGLLDEAAEELLRGYILGCHALNVDSGSEVFKNEDPKYLKFLKTRARLDDTFVPPPKKPEKVAKPPTGARITSPRSENR